MMAFYSYRSDADDYRWTPNYSSKYNMASTPTQAASFPYHSSYEFDEPKVGDYDSFITPSLSIHSDYIYTEPGPMQFSPMEYHSSYYHEYNEYSVNPSHVNYAVSYYSEPKLLQYDPALQNRGYVSSETNFKISYSTQEFNAPEFKEYSQKDFKMSDSTQEFNAPEFKEYSPNPYGGGYDPITTYGRPRSPSDEICYPRSIPKLDVVSLDDFSYGSIPPPYGKDDNLSTKPLNNWKETDPKDNPEIPELETRDSKVTNLGLDGETGGDKPFPSIPSDNSPSKHDDNLDGDGSENARNGNYGDESEIQAHQISYGSGLESMDLCESLFGYWPCLAKREQQQREKCREACDQENDPWKIAADYLFGNPVVYNFENYHYQQHNQSQYQSYGNSWLH